MRNRLLLFLAFFFSFYSISLKAQQGLFINEVMGSTDTTILDNTGQNEDWLELYNSTASAVNLNGYYISNDVNSLTKFRFSGGLQVPAHGYLILWASNDTPRGHTHLPFKVSASGESLYLTLPDGITLENTVSLGQQKTDVSYGRTTDGASQFSFFAKPTPGATNNTSIGYLGIVSPPVFSVNAGFYAAPFSVTISSGDPAAQIIYTTDGSLPNAGNLNGTVYRYKNQYVQNPGQLPGPFLNDSFRSVSYSNALAITDASVKPNRLSVKSSTFDFTPYYFPTTLINKATLVRAVAVKAGYIPSEATTASYFITAGGINKYTLPVISLATSEDNLFSYDKGFYNAGADFDAWRAANPTLAAGGGRAANWYRDMEIPASLEVFGPNQTTRAVQTNVGLKINGAFSTLMQQKAFRVYFRSSYGASDLNYQILPDLPYKNYERIVLSNAGQDMYKAHMRDMVCQAAIKHLRLETSHSTPTIAFVNGEFWGLLNARERYDDNHFQRVYGIDPAEIDVIENGSTVQYGTNDEIKSLRAFFSANSMTVPANYAIAESRMDFENFIDYNIAEVYFGNTDWPGNNLLFFRKRVPYTPTAPYGHDGRFRWVAQDFDRGLDAYGSNGVTYNTLAWAMGTHPVANPSGWATEMIRKLVANPDFRNKFITRYADLNNTSFRPEIVSAVINTHRDLMNPHIAEHLARWKRYSVNAWNDSVNRMITYANNRPFYARQHLRGEFSLSSEKQLTIDVSDTTQGFIHVNTIDITPAFPGVPSNPYPWTGLYYSEVPVTLIAKPKQGYRFVRWEGDTTSTKDTIVVTLASAKSYKAIFETTVVPVSKVVFNYWHFNSLPTGTLTSVAADSTLTGNAVITYPGTGAGFIDNVNPGSIVNVQFGQTAGLGLRPRNPSATRSLLINSPTTGYKDIVLTYAATRTSSGAEYQRVFYTINGIVWQLKKDSILVSTPEATFGLQTIDFSADAGTSDNPAFAVRIEFFGNNAAGTSGNNRFDNIAVSGTLLPPPVSKVFNYWHFNNLPTGTLTSVAADTSLTGNAVITYPGTGAGYMDRVDPGSIINVQFDKPAGLGLRPRNPSATRSLVINTPTTHYKDIVLTYAATRTSSGAEYQRVFYTTDGTVWQLKADNILVSTPEATFGLQTIDFSTDAGASDNPAFAVRIEFFGNNAALASGNNRFDNIAVSGIPLPVVQLPTVTISSDRTTVCTTSTVTFTATATNAGASPSFQWIRNGANVGTNSNTYIDNNFVNGDNVYCILTINTTSINSNTVSITVIPSPVTINLTKTSPSSSCTADGQIVIEGLGGISPYQYGLGNTNYASANTFTNLSGGTYTAYAKDAMGCTAEFTDELTKPSAPVITSLDKTPASACAIDGIITINSSGGVAPYQYSLDDVNYFASNVFNNLAGGTYTAYVKDAGGCIATFTDVLTTSGSSSLVITSLDKSAASACVNDGIITINSSGGIEPYQYSLNNVDYFTSNIFSNLAGGTYTAYVKDAGGCIATFTDVLAGATSSLVITSLDKSPASACANDGIITINTSGGTAPYQYSLNGTDYFASNVFSNLASGTYTAYVKDAGGCTTTLTDVLTRATSSLAITSLTKVAASACVPNDGSITINWSGGTAPYQYSLNGVDYFASNVFSNLAPDNYTAYVKDAGGCIATFADVLTRATSSLAITSLTKVAASACVPNDGSITINWSGGTAPYQYSLNGVDYFASNVFSNLAPDNYTAYVKDAGGCIATFADVLTRATSSLAITSLTKVAASACANDGSITINRSGGVAPYQYSLNNVNYFTSNVFSNLASGSYTAYVKDAGGCIASFTDVLTRGTSSLVITSVGESPASACANDGKLTVNRSGGTSPFQYSLNGVDYFTSNILSNVAAGAYTVYVKDSRNCIASFTDVLNKYSALVITSLTKIAASPCGGGGRITINRTGGTSPYQYSLNGVNYFTSNVFSNLAGGTYTAYVKDARNCIATLTDVLATSGTSSLSITSVGESPASACANDGKLTVNKSGGTSPFQYSLNNVNYFTSNILSNVPAGAYTVYVKDATGCVASFSDVLNKYSPLVITSVTRVNSTSCTPNGRLTINRTGGTSPYQYSLNNVNYFTSNIFSNLAAGTYTAYVKDARNCITSLSGIVLTGPSCLTARPAVKEQIVTSAKLSIKAFPNPSAEQFSVIAESRENSVVEFIVTDLAGRKLLSTRTAANTVFTIGKQLSSGIYFIQALQGKERATLKIVKGK